MKKITEVDVKRIVARMEEKSKERTEANRKKLGIKTIAEIRSEMLSLKP